MENRFWSGRLLKFDLQAGKTLLITGPASLRLERGGVTVFGAPLQPRQKLTVMKEKQLPIEIIHDSTLEAELGERASYLEIQGTATPDSWMAAAEAFQKLEVGKALVIGSTDTGKSTLCTFLTNHSLKLERNVAVIDADIGQSDLGPPGSLGLSIITSPLISLENSRVDAMIFIGETSPSSVTEKVVRGILKLGEKIPKDTATVINTDGWVTGEEAVAFKTRLMEELKPNLTIALAEGDELNPIFDAYTNPVLRVQVPKFIKVRSREERRRLREHGYRKYLRNAIHKNLSLERIKADSLFTKRLEGGEILGFSDRDGFLFGIGVLENLNRRRKILRAYTNVSTRDVAEIECGDIRLSYHGAELDWQTPHRQLS